MRAITLSRFLAAVVGFILLLSVPSPARQGAPAGVDDFVNSEMRRQRIPGLSLAVVKDGHVILIKGYGLADVEHQVSVKPKTVFQSGSMGKQFTATAVLTLVEDGWLSLDDKIGRYFLDAPESWKNITVRRLLTHTSGSG